MTDFEKVLSVLVGMAGVGRTRFEQKRLDVPEEDGAVVELVIPNSESPGVGYSGFYTVWSFDASGKCVSIGNYE